jgi:hypothetical protein
MGKPNLKIAGEPPPRTPQREALAAAQLRHSAAVDRLAAIQAARERTAQTQRGARDAIKAATAGVEQAKLDAASALAGGTPGGQSVKEARAALQDAEDALEASVEASGTLVASEKEAGDELQYARMALDEKLRDVVRSEANVAQLLKEAEAVQVDLVSRRVVLRHLFNSGFVAEQETDLRDFLLFKYQLPTGRGQVEYENFDAHPAADPWRQALQELRENADAPLPS